jgi:hypothetical protein
MSSVELSDQEWGVLMGVLSEAPWKIANPLLMKIGEQLRQQHQPPPPNPVPTPDELKRMGGNSREVGHE